MAGLTAAGLHLTPLAGLAGLGFLSLFSLLGLLPLLWLGLRLGFQSVFIASVLTFAILMVSRLVVGDTGSVIGTVLQLLSVIVISRWSLLSRETTQGDEWYPSGYILIYITLITFAMTLMTYYMLPADGLPIDKLSLQKLSTEISGSSSGGVDLYESILRMMTFYPAINGLSNLLLVVGNAVLAQKILEFRGENVRPKGTLQDLRIPQVYLWILTGALGLAATGITGQLGVNVAIVALAPYVFAGLAMVHRTVKQYKMGMISLVTFYFIMLLFGWTIVLVALMGIIEPWLEDHLKKLETTR